MKLHRSELEFGWAVGFFEGEGAISVGSNGKTPRLYLHLSLHQNDPEPLEKFRRIVMVGVVNGPYGRVAGRNPFWTWQARSNGWTLIDSMYPHLSRRRQQQVDATKARCGR